MWLSMHYSECPFPYSSMFCSRCPTWNSIYIQSWAGLYGVEKVLFRLNHIEFKANVVICAFTGQKKSCSGWNTQNSRQMWLSVRYPECLTPYCSMFCSRCPTWNSIYIRSWADLYHGVEKVLFRLKQIEFKANMVICALPRMPCSIQQYVLLKMLYLEQYLYNNALLRIAVCSARGARNAVIQGRAFGVGHAALQIHPK